MGTSRQGTLIVEPSHGLCNRLRVIRSALNLAQIFHLKLVVLWRVNKELKCKYEDIFQESDLFKVINIKDNFFGKVYCRIKRLMAKKVITQANIKDYKEEKFVRFFENNVFKKKTIYIKTFDEFFIMSPQIGYDWLIPVKKLRDKIDELVSSLGSKAIGIHIRRTDNSIAIEASPIELFTNKIQEDIEKNPQTKFFLATDDKDVKSFLMERFAGKVYAMDCVLNRDPREGMEASVIDLFVLSKMTLLYGSHWSSFSEEAAKIGSIELKVLHI